MMLRHLPSRPHSQRGAATLIVVMVLFLVMALLAGYANRSLVFEQRIAGGYYKASLAQEVAEGGVEWTVAMLNGTAIDGACQPVATGGTRFIDKYMSVSPADRAGTRLVTTQGLLAADCVRDGGGLTCRCPDADTRTAQSQTTVPGALAPSFGVRLGTDTAKRYGNFQVMSYGCSDSSVDNCYIGAISADRSRTATALSEQMATVGFIAAVPSSPSAPLTVKGTLTTGGTGGLGLHNTDPATAGTLVVSGGAAPTLIDSRMDTTPGTPAAQAQVFSNSQLSGMNDTVFFQSFMGMAPSRYRQHPAMRQVACPVGGDCGPALLAAYNAGARMIWVEGPLTINSNVIIGTTTAPALIVANGAVTLGGPFQLTGMLVALGDLDWTNNSGLTSLITGMVLVQNDMTATGGMDIVYRRDIADQLRNRIGSYARVSGGLQHSDNSL
jgi:Tfp pilus assembly protein PilX